MNDIPRNDGLSDPPHIDPKAPALLVRMDRNPFHHGTLAAIRTLGRINVEVHAVLEGTHDPAARSKYLTSCSRWTEAPSASDSFLSSVLAAADRLDNAAVLLPLDDITAIYTAQHSHTLAPRFRISNPASELPSQLADKHALATICAHLGVPHPDTHVVDSPESLEYAESTYGYPMMAKWARPWLVTRDSKFRSTTLIHSPERLREVAAQAAGQRSELLLQRYIPPAPHGDWFFHGYFRSDSSCGFAGTGIKQRAYPRTAGITTLGRWLHNPRIDELARKLAKSMGYMGILDMDFRYNTVDDQYYLLDFNPRVGAQFRLFDDSNSLDVIRAAYLDLTGQPCDPGAPEYGRTYLVENYDLLGKLAWKRSEKKHGGRGWLSSLRHANELAWYTKDDFVPFVRMVKQTCVRAVKGRSV